jgi:hypothetical protein
MITILIVLAVLMLLGAIPAWPQLGLWPERWTRPGLAGPSDSGLDRSNLGA